SLRGIEEHAVRFAVFAFRDFAAERIESRFGDTCFLQSGAVNHGRMSVCTSQDHRSVRRNSVEILPGRKRRWLPVSFDPTTTGHPLPGLCLIHARLNLGEKILETCCSFEIERHLAKADTRQMLVGISKSWQHSFAMKIDDAC